MLVIENCNSLSEVRQKLIDGEEVRTVRQKPCEVSEYDKDHIWYKGNQYISLRRFLEVKTEAEKGHCEDAVNRDMALEKMADYVASGYADSVKDFEEYSRIICQLPPVTPEPKTIQEKQAESEKYDKAFDDGYKNGYAQARFDYEQEPKTGHWIYRIYGEFHEEGNWHCSGCDYIFNGGYGHAEYCPKCGCEMSEAPTEEVMSEYGKRRCNYPNDI